MRTVWLAFFCLIGLAIAAVVKLGMAPYASTDYPRSGGSSPKADVSLKIVQPVEVAASPDSSTSTTNVTSAKGDELDASYTVEGSAAPISVKPGLVAPAETEPKPKHPDKTKIVSRHWHDPLDKRDAQAARASAKRRLTNASTARRHVVSAGATKP